MKVVQQKATPERIMHFRSLVQDARRRNSEATNGQIAEDLLLQFPDVSRKTMMDWMSICDNMTEKLTNAYTSGKISFYMLSSIAGGKIDPHTADILYDHVMERRFRPADVIGIRGYMREKRCLVDEAVKVATGEVDKPLPGGKKQTDFTAVVAKVDRCTTEFQSLVMAAKDFAPLHLIGPNQDHVRIYEASIVFEQAALRAYENARKIREGYRKEIERWRNEKMGSIEAPLLEEKS